MAPTDNPNAAVAGGSGLLSIGVVWFIGNVWPHASVSAEMGAAIAGAVSAVALFVGREGLRGICRTLMNGTGRSANGRT
jgi:hypothetical protein